MSDRKESFDLWLWTRMWDFLCHSAYNDA
jgi:hypothetical protein